MSRTLLTPPPGAKRTDNDHRAGRSHQDRIGLLPIWIRSPVEGPEYFTGFSRQKLYLLAGARKIRSVSIRERGEVQGTRLFHLQSILDFIDRSEREALAEADTTPAVSGEGR